MMKKTHLPLFLFVCSIIPALLLLSILTVSPPATLHFRIKNEEKRKQIARRDIIVEVWTLLSSGLGSLGSTDGYRNCIPPKTVITIIGTPKTPTMLSSSSSSSVRHQR